MVDGDETLDRYADLIRQPTGDGRDVAEQFFGVFLGNEGEAQAFLLCCKPCSQGYGARGGQDQRLSTAQTDRHQNALSSIAAAASLNAAQCASAVSQSPARTAAPTWANRSASA